MAGRHRCRIVCTPARTHAHTCLAQHFTDAVALDHTRLTARVDHVRFRAIAHVRLQPRRQRSAMVRDAAPFQDAVAELDLVARDAIFLRGEGSRSVFLDISAANPVSRAPPCHSVHSGVVLAARVRARHGAAAAATVHALPGRPERLQCQPKI